MHLYVSQQLCFSMQLSSNAIGKKTMDNPDVAGTFLQFPQFGLFWCEPGICGLNLVSARFSGTECRCMWWETPLGPKTSKKSWDPKMLSKAINADYLISTCWKTIGHYLLCAYWIVVPAMPACHPKAGAWARSGYLAKRRPWLLGEKTFTGSPCSMLNVHGRGSEVIIQQIPKV